MRRWAYRCKKVQKYLNRQKNINGLNAESSESPLNAIQHVRRIFIKMISKLEEKYGWEKLIEMNDFIGKQLEFKPEIEWRMSNGNSTCYNPKNVGNYYNTTLSQKIECERWYKEQLEKYPDGWVIKEGFKPQSKEWYPFFYQDWNALIPAIVKLQEKNVQIKLSTNIEDVFELVYLACA